MNVNLYISQKNILNLLKKISLLKKVKQLKQILISNMKAVLFPPPPQGASSKDELCPIQTEIGVRLGES